MKRSSKSGVASNFLAMYMLLVIVSSVHAASAFTLPAWSDIFSSLKPVRNMGPNLDNSQLHELLGRSEDFDELNLMEEGEPRYGLVQLGTGTGTAYNVTLNLTGHILMAIGISLYLLMYMWFKAMGGYNSGYHYVKRRSFREKRALDDEEKAMVEMLYRILSSLSEEQVDDVLKQFEKEVIKQASEKQGILGSQSFGEDCVKQFLCRLLVSDSAMELSRASSKMRVMNLLQDALNETDDSNDLYNTVSENQNLNNLSPSSYSIYEWNDLIQMILGSRKPLNTKVEDHLFLTKGTENNQNDVNDMFKDLYSHFNIIPSKVTEYLRVQDFSIGLRKENTEASTTSSQQSCERRFRKCNLPML